LKRVALPAPEARGRAPAAEFATSKLSCAAAGSNSSPHSSSGVPVAALNLVVTMLTALTTVIAMRMVGVLLVSAMIVIPALAGFALARSFRGALGIAVAVALAAVGTGLVLAYYLRLAAGASVVLTWDPAAPRIIAPGDAPPEHPPVPGGPARDGSWVAADREPG